MNPTIAIMNREDEVPVEMEPMPEPYQVCEYFNHVINSGMMKPW